MLRIEKTIEIVLKHENEIMHVTEFYFYLCHVQIFISF
jgi:hypothetical protein